MYLPIWGAGKWGEGTARIGLVGAWSGVGYIGGGAKEDAEPWYGPFNGSKARN